MPDEDLRGGFEHGGWALPYKDAVMGRIMGRGSAPPVGGGVTKYPLPSSVAPRGDDLRRDNVGPGRIRSGCGS
jgi:hypothetical protein